MSGQYFVVDSRLFSSNPQNRFVMINRMLSCSGKLRDHVISCGKEDCDICKKFRCWMEIFIKYEKDENKEVQIGQIIDENFVEKVFFSDEAMKILN